MLLQFWAGVINCTFDILKIISRTSRMPDIPEHILIKDPSVPEAAHMTAIPAGAQITTIADVDDDAIPYINALRHARRQHLLISTSQREDLDLPKDDIKNVNLFRKAQREEEQLVPAAFEKGMQHLLTTGEHLLNVWDAEAVDCLEAAYKSHVQAKMHRYGRFTDPTWQTAMRLYRDEIRKKLVDSWQKRIDDIRAKSQGQVDAATRNLRLALQHAIRKLRYILDMMEADAELMFNLPLPSPGYLEDSLKHLERYKLTFRYVSVQHAIRLHSATTNPANAVKLRWRDET